MEILDRLNETGICELVRISPHDVKSKHVIICITGFLQEDADKGSYWEHLVEFYKYAEIYAVNWNALTMGNFLSGGTF